MLAALTLPFCAASASAKLVLRTVRVLVVSMQTLSLMGWNPMSLGTGDYRLDDIPGKFSSIGIIGLVGTRVKQFCGETYHNVTTTSHMATHFGYGRGRHTNHSTGCCILVGCKMRPKNICKFRTPPADLAGRGGRFNNQSWTYVGATNCSVL